MANPERLLLWMVFGAILAIAYSIKRMYMLERSIAAIEVNIHKLLQLIAMDEQDIKEKEDIILAKLGGKKSAPKRRSTKKRSKKRR